MFFTNISRCALRHGTAAIGLLKIIAAIIVILHSVNLFKAAAPALSGAERIASKVSEWPLKQDSHTLRSVTLVSYWYVCRLWTVIEAWEEYFSGNVYGNL
jgi:hypothetical protein